MKIRIGVGFGARNAISSRDFLSVVDALETLKFDSIWLTERIGAQSLDPVVAMAAAAARTEKLKIGTSVMVLPGRNPVVLAKQIASLDQLSNGRILPAFGLGAVDESEQQAFGVSRQQRGSIFNEAITVMRKCWLDENLTFAGDHFSYHNVKVLPKPIQLPPDVWLGGIANSELRRVAEYGDGWLPSFVTPDEAKSGWEKINDHLQTNSRAIDPEHFGVLISYSPTIIADHLLEPLRARRPDATDINSIVPQSWNQLVDTINAFIEVGASKFVVLPMTKMNSPKEWSEHLAELATYTQPLQT